MKTVRDPKTNALLFTYTEEEKEQMNLLQKVKSLEQLVKNVTDRVALLESAQREVCVNET